MVNHHMGAGGQMTLVGGQMVLVVGSFGLDWEDGVVGLIQLGNAIHLCKVVQKSPVRVFIN